MAKQQDLYEKLGQTSGPTSQQAVAAATGSGQYEGVIPVHAYPNNVLVYPTKSEEANLMLAPVDQIQVAPIDPAPGAVPFTSVGEAIVSVNFDGEEGIEVTGSANNFYEVDFSQSESANDLVDTSSTLIDGVLTISDGQVTGSLTHTNGDILTYDMTHNDHFFLAMIWKCCSCRVVVLHRTAAVSFRRTPPHHTVLTSTFWQKTTSAFYALWSPLYWAALLPQEAETRFS